MTGMEGVDAIVANAQRLSDDAQLLFDNGRHRSALGLAALSVEEAGKACLVRWTMKGWLPEQMRKAISTGHIDKQRILGTFLFVRAMLEAAKEFYEDSANVPQDLQRKPDEAADQFALRIWRRFMDPDNPKFVEFVTGQALDRHHRDAFHLEVGTVEWQKQIGFYLDVDEKMQPSRWPAVIDDKDSSKMLDRAREALKMARMNDLVQEGMCAVYKNGPMVDRELRAKMIAYLRASDPRSLREADATA